MSSRRFKVFCCGSVDRFLRSPRGFTLVELTITMLIGLFILLSMSFVYLNYLDAWNQGASLLELQREGNLVLEEMLGEIRRGESVIIDKFQAGDPDNSMVTITFAIGEKIKFYQDTGSDPYCIKRKEGEALAETIAPEKIFDNNVSRWVNRLVFTKVPPATPSRVRIEMELKCQEGEFEEAVCFTSAAYFRN